MNPTEPSTPAPPTPWIVEVDARSFEREVLLRSRELPVVVDFWATWCGPCKELGPLLEQRAREGAGRFLQAKVDVDRNPELVQALRIEGVPAVMLVVNGKIANGFQGALPAAELDRFLDEFAPHVAGETPPLEAAQALVEAGRADDAARLLAEHLEREASDDQARLLLAELHAEANRLDEAEAELGLLTTETHDTARAKALRARLDFARGSEDLDTLRHAAAAAPEDAAARRALGEALVTTGDNAAGLEELLEAVRLDPAGEGLAAKARMLEVFELLGLEDPLANDYRFKLSMQLFA